MNTAVKPVNNMRAAELHSHLLLYHFWLYPDADDRAGMLRAHPALHRRGCGQRRHRHAEEAS